MSLSFLIIYYLVSIVLSITIFVFIVFKNDPDFLKQFDDIPFFQNLIPILLIFYTLIVGIFYSFYNFYKIMF